MHNHKEKPCVECHELFKPHAPMHIRCGVCRKIYRDRYNSDYKKKYFKENHKEISLKNNGRRLTRRRMIQEWWGRVGGCRGTWVNLKWRDSERLALHILPKEGFVGANVITELFPVFPFDVCAEKNGKLSVIQVTMRTHVDRVKQHRALADMLRLPYYVLYVRPDFKYYLLKCSDESGFYELKMSDMEKVKEV